jgi:hypothetical protein
LVTLAQKRLSMKKQMTKYAAKRTGEQWLAMNQQMIEHDKFVPIVGKDGELAMEKIEPLMLQGRYQIDVDQMDESELRQEQGEKRRRSSKSQASSLPSSTPTRCR